MRYLVIKNGQDISKGGKAKYWGYPDGKSDQAGKPYGWTTDYELMHLYESDVKLRYAKAEVIKQCTNVEAKHITTSEVWL